MDVFHICRQNNSRLLQKALGKVSTDKVQTLINGYDGCGRSPLHICATYGCNETLAFLLRCDADIHAQDIENGWTPMARALYAQNYRCAFLLLRAGAQLTNNNIDTSAKKRISASAETCPSDRDGKTPWEMLSHQLAPTLLSTSCRLSVMSFGKCDLFLGLPMRLANEVANPLPIEDIIKEQIHQVVAAKYHSLALSAAGEVFSWGYGKSGRLGHNNEENKIVPTRISFFKNFIVSQIAASENHSIAITSTGAVFSWGSNSCGQLGIDKVSKFATTPQRIEALKRFTVVKIAAGRFHNVAMAASGELFTWGSNHCCQCGFGIETETIFTPRKLRWEKQIITVCAGYENTLLLCKSGNSTSPFNEVYQLGNKSLPTKVLFKQKRKSSLGSFEESGLTAELKNDRLVQIVQLAAGKFDNLAMSSSGLVYTWKQDTVNSIPSILEALLPEQGGGKVVFINACTTRACVVTDTGNVFAWSFSVDSASVAPQLVPGLKRVVTASIGEDHTLAVVSAYIPPLPFQPVDDSVALTSSIRDSTEVDESFECGEDSRDASFIQDPPDTCVSSTILTMAMTLKQYCERTIAKNIDLRNALQMLLFAERTHSTELLAFTDSFIKNNFDGILTFGRVSDHQLLLDDIDLLVSALPVPPRIKVHSRSIDGQGNDSCNLLVERKRAGSAVEDKLLSGGAKSKDTETLPGTLRLIKATKKKLSSIYELETALLNGGTAGDVQLEKLGRKAGLEAELRSLELSAKRLQQQECKGEKKDVVLITTPTKPHLLKENATPHVSNKSLSVKEESFHVVQPKDTPKKKKFVNLDSFEKKLAVGASAQKVPSFHDWGAATVVANTPTLPPASAKHSPWNSRQINPPVPAARENDVAKQASRDRGRSGSAGLITADAFIALTPTKSTFNLESFVSPQSKQKGAQPVSAVKPIPSPAAVPKWSAPTASTKSPISLDRIQYEEELLRRNGNTSELKGNENPWFMERRLRTDSFENIVECQMKQAAEESEVQAAILAVHALEQRRTSNADSRTPNMKSRSSLKSR